MTSYVQDGAMTSYFTSVRRSLLRPPAAL